MIDRDKTALKRWIFASIGMAFLCTPLVRGETAEGLRESAVLQARILVSAMNARRYDIVALMTPEKFRAATGGVDGIRQVMEQIESEGTGIQKVELGEVLSSAEYDGESFVTIATKMQLRIEDGECLVEGTLLGVTADSGKTWEFLQVDETFIPKMASYSNDLVKKLVFPKPKMRMGDFRFQKQDGEWRPDAETLRKMREIMDSRQKR
jgi:hypothetical protein